MQSNPGQGSVDWNELHTSRSVPVEREQRGGRIIPGQSPTPRVCLAVSSDVDDTGGSGLTQPGQARGGASPARPRALTAPPPGSHATSGTDQCPKEAERLEVLKRRDLGGSCCFKEIHVQVANNRSMREIGMNNYQRNKKKSEHDESSKHRHQKYRLYKRKLNIYQ